MAVERTSRRFASILRSPIIETGNRSDIVFKVGLRLTNFVRFAEDQSTYSVESAVAQNFRSLSSLVNLGIFFLVIIVRRSPIRSGSCP